MLQEEEDKFREEAVVTLDMINITHRITIEKALKGSYDRGFSEGALSVIQEKEAS